MEPFTLAFLAALAVTVAARLWLARRHLRHMQAHRDRVPDAFAAAVSLEAHQKAADYSSAKTRLHAVQVLLDAALALAFTLGGGLQALWNLSSGALGAGIAGGVALVAGMALLAGAAELPLAAWRVFVIEQRYGFNRMSPATFAGDLAKSLLLAAALGLPLLALVLWLMQQTGALWWLYAWGAWVAFNLFVLAVYPTWIAPLFNRFTPLEDPELKARIGRLLERCGFAARGLFVMDGSRRSSHGNAYFTGFGRSRRIVFFDTLLARLAPAEIEAVLAHELGHFRLRHVAKRLAWTFAASLGFLWLLGQLIEQDWFYAGLGVASRSTALALALFFIALPFFTFPLQPLVSLYSRRHEYEADRYASRHASAADLERALVRLYQDNAATLTPDPLHSAFYDTHPPAPLRVARLRAAAHNSRSAI